MTKKDKICIIAVTLAYLVFDSDAIAMDLGVVGKTYPILERDGADELRERVNAVNWKEVLAKSNLKSKMLHFKPGSLRPLPCADRDRSRLVAMDYTLDYDITDGNGNIIYPRGYTFNPLDYMSYNRIVIVIDGDDRRQVEWFKTSAYFKKLNVMVLITDGDYYELSRELGQPVFFLDDKIARRLQLQVVPSIIAQKNRMMEVSELGDKCQAKVSTDK